MRASAAGHARRFFVLSTGCTLLLRDVSLWNGNAKTTVGILGEKNGGAILANDGAVLIAENVVFNSNTAPVGLVRVRLVAGGGSRLLEWTKARTAPDRYGGSVRTGWFPDLAYCTGRPGGPWPPLGPPPEFRGCANTRVFYSRWRQLGWEAGHPRAGIQYINSRISNHP